jgi:hypothetical protein
MISKFRKRMLGSKKTTIIIALAIIVIFALLLSPLFGEEVSFRIEDKCGRFVNLISHTIPDEEACATRCRNQCNSIEKGYVKAAFEESFTACHGCTCFCR